MQEQDKNKYDCLKLKNQLCFPLYAVSREILKKYTPFLKELNLTYTQYIVLMVLWEKTEITVGELGKMLYLDTGTLSPLLKSMEKTELVCRSRDKNDERIVKVSITEKGSDLKERAVEIPSKMGSCLNISAEEAENLYKLLYKMLES
ncbi:MAG: MarR family transcriptional regulator [Treponema sp.]|nr:MarR family transcriptional regulator [Treponema sp.]